MTIATRDEDSVGSSPAQAVVLSEFPRRRRLRVDVVGAAALVLAAAGLVGSMIVLLRPVPATAPQTTSAPPVRDEWYLETPTVPTVESVGQPPLQVADRWWEDTPSAAPSAPSVGGPPLRDQWYLDAPAESNTPKLSTPPRDQWYLNHQEPCCDTAVQP